MKNYICIEGERIQLSQESAQNIKESLQKPKDRIDEIIAGLPDDDFVFISKPKSRICREFIDRQEYVKIPLPNSNPEWTFWAFDCVKQFVKEYGTGCYPIHEDEPGFDNTKWLYIRICK